MKTLRKLAAVVLLLSSVTAYAGQQTGQITNLMTRQSDGLVYFLLAGSSTGKPTCATQSYWMIKDENSAAGKRLIAFLLSARLTGQTITVSGSNTCSRWFDGEDLEFINF